MEETHLDEQQRSIDDFDIDILRIASTTMFIAKFNW